MNLYYAYLLAIFFHTNVDFQSITKVSIINIPDHMSEERKNLSQGKFHSFHNTFPVLHENTNSRTLLCGTSNGRITYLFSEKESDCVPRNNGEIDPIMLLSAVKVAVAYLSCVHRYQYCCNFSLTSIELG